MIDETARISSKAIIGKNVSIGAYSIIGKKSVIGNDVIIQSHCEIGVWYKSYKNEKTGFFRMFYGNIDL